MPSLDPFDYQAQSWIPLSMNLKYELWVESDGSEWWCSPVGENGRTKKKNSNEITRVSTLTAGVNPLRSFPSTDIKSPNIFDRLNMSFLLWLFLEAIKVDENVAKATENERKMSKRELRFFFFINVLSPFIYYKTSEDRRMRRSKIRKSHYGLVSITVVRQKLRWYLVANDVILASYYIAIKRPVLD